MDIETLKHLLGVCNDNQAHLNFIKFILLSNPEISYFFYYIKTFLPKNKKIKT